MTTVHGEPGRIKVVGVSLRGPAGSGRLSGGGRSLRGLRDEALRTFALDHGTSREVVVHVETCLIFEHRRTWVTPDFESR